MHFTVNRNDPSLLIYRLMSASWITPTQDLMIDQETSMLMEKSNNSSYYVSYVLWSFRHSWGHAFITFAPKGDGGLLKKEPLQTRERGGLHGEWSHDIFLRSSIVTRETELLTWYIISSLFERYCFWIYSFKWFWFQWCYSVLTFSFFTWVGTSEVNCFWNKNCWRNEKPEKGGSILLLDAQYKNFKL